MACQSIYEKTLTWTYLYITLLYFYYTYNNILTKIFQCGDLELNNNVES